MKPSPCRGTLATLRTAADLTGISLTRLEELIRCNTLRCERIKGDTYVDIDEAERVEREAYS